MQKQVLAPESDTVLSKECVQLIITQVLEKPSPQLPALYNVAEVAEIDNYRFYKMKLYLYTKIAI